MANFFSKKYWERKFVDLWSVVHFKTGVTFAFIPHGLDLPYYQGFLMLFIFASIWEYAEILKIPKEIRETTINKITDIVVALVGLTLVYLLMPAFQENPILYISIALPLAAIDQPTCPGPGIRLRAVGRGHRDQPGETRRVSRA